MKIKPMKLLGVAAIAALSLAVLAGCGPKDSDPADTSTPDVSQTAQVDGSGVTEAPEVTETPEVTPDGSGDVTPTEDPGEEPVNGQEEPAEEPVVNEPAEAHTEPAPAEDGNSSADDASTEDIAD